ncbi:RNA polymerase sigma-70 factor, ECF subfamily [Bacillus pseudomycoides]|nr:RNA polymerase sigma-70 factor, ECF subfamily [Bacillus pseudomycoides]
MEMEQLYQAYKPLLFSLAYRMLGSVNEGVYFYSVSFAFTTVI